MINKWILTDFKIMINTPLMYFEGNRKDWYNDKLKLIIKKIKNFYNFKIDIYY